MNDDCTIQICDFGLSRSLEEYPEPVNEDLDDTNQEIEPNNNIEENK